MRTDSMPSLYLYKSNKQIFHHTSLSPCSRKAPALMRYIEESCVPATGEEVESSSVTSTCKDLECNLDLMLQSEQKTEPRLFLSLLAICVKDRFSRSILLLCMRP